MAKLFLNIWPYSTLKCSPKGLQFCPSRFKKLPNTERTLNHLTKIHKMLPNLVTRITFTLCVVSNMTNIKTIYGRNLLVQSRNMGYFQARYNSRVVNYNRRGFIRLDTDQHIFRLHHFTLVNYDSRVAPDLKIPHITTLIRNLQA